MNAKILVFAVLLLAFVPTLCFAEAIASTKIGFTAGVGDYKHFDDCIMSAYVRNSAEDLSEKIYFGVVGNSNEEDTYRISSTAPGFSDFMMHLMDNTKGNIILYFERITDNGPVFFSGATLETTVFDAVKANDIDAISVTMDIFKIIHSDDNPYSYTDIKCYTTMSFEAPEPSSFVLLAIGIASASLFFWRKSR